MDKLLGHLAQFASFSKQSEVLCTQGLAYLMRNAEGERAFCELIGEAAGCAVEAGLHWRAESVQTDGGRPDLEGRTDTGFPLVKVEAKLGASFGTGQLESYVCALSETEVPGVLVILLPDVRRDEASRYIAMALRTSGDGPWRVQGKMCDVPAVVLAWEEVFIALESVSSDSFRDDVAQLRAMYRVFNGDDMEPITNDEEVLAWRQKEDWWGTLVDLVTRRLSDAESVMPFGREKGAEPYYRRYVCRPVASGHSCYSIGTRDPFENHKTPVWLRFNKSTGNYGRIARNLEASGLMREAVVSGGHPWFPLTVPLNSERNAMVEELVAQAQRIVDAAWSNQAG